MLLGKTFIQLTQKYIGAVSAQLSHLEIDRHFYLLHYIASSDKPLTQKELAMVINEDKSSMVRVIDYLVDHGYVKRVQNRSDRRECFIVLTSKAEAIIPDIASAFDLVEQEARKDLDIVQVDNLLKDLETISDNFQRLPTAPVKLAYKRPTTKKLQNDVL